MCDCKVCARHREYKLHIKLLENADLDASIEFFEKIYEDLNHAEMDRAVHKSILDGTWPSAREFADQIIERLERI